MSATVTRALLVIAVLGTFGCDRLTKHVAELTLANGPERSYLGDTIRLGYVENPGGFLGFGASLPPAIRTAVFTAATGTLLLVIIVLLFRGKWRGWAALGLTLFAAGGASNWIDRVMNDGTVVDFLNVGIGTFRTGIFNVADVAIMAGAFLFILAELTPAKAAEPVVESPPASADGDPGTVDKDP